VAGEEAVRWKITVEIWKRGKSTVKCGRKKSSEEGKYC
jgi:hypothetical protein